MPRSRLAILSRMYVSYFIAVPGLAYEQALLQALALLPRSRTASKRTRNKEDGQVGEEEEEEEETWEEATA